MCDHPACQTQAATTQVTTHVMCEFQVLMASQSALVKLAPPLERWQTSTAALLDDLGGRLAAAQMPPAAAVACQARDHARAPTMQRCALGKRS